MMSESVMEKREIEKLGCSCATERSRDGEVKVVKNRLLWEACAATWGNGDIGAELLLRAMSGSVAQ